MAVIQSSYPQAGLWITMGIVPSQELDAVPKSAHPVHPENITTIGFINPNQ